MFRAIAAVTISRLLEDTSKALNYNLTWSTDGVINQYCKPCEAIVNGVEHRNDKGETFRSACDRAPPWHVAVTARAMAIDVPININSTMPAPGGQTLIPSFDGVLLA
jgi:hypothetical protein